MANSFSDSDNFCFGAKDEISYGQQIPNEENFVLVPRLKSLVIGENGNNQCYIDRIGRSCCLHRSGSQLTNKFPRNYRCDIFQFGLIPLFSR